MTCANPKMSSASALLSLRAANARANEVLKDDHNKHLVSVHNGASVLNVGHVRSNTPMDKGGIRYIATIGRKGDIVLHDETISRLHCAFLADFASQCVAFVKLSDPKSSHAYGEDATKPNKAIRVDRKDGLCSIELGKEGGKKYRFDIIWHYPFEETLSRMQSWFVTHLKVHPFHAETLQVSDSKSDDELLGTCQPPGEIKSWAPKNGNAMWEPQGKPIGRGACGEVYRAVTVGSKEVIAVKVLRRPTNMAKWAVLKREVEIHSALTHVGSSLHV